MINKLRKNKKVELGQCSYIGPAVISAKERTYEVVLARQKAIGQAFRRTIGQ